MKKTQSENKEVGLKRVLGFPALFVIAIGVVTAQSCFVSTLIGAGIGGATFFIAILIAFILTLCYASTYSELSLMMPKAGSISTYTAVAMGHFPAIIAAIAGYLAPILFGGPVELLLVDYILDVVYPGAFSYVGLILLIVLTIFNVLGINIFSTVQNVLTYTMLIALLVVGFAAFSPASTTAGNSPSVLWQQFTTVNSGVFSLVILAIWAFLSVEFICPLIEETKQPEKNIPKTMFIAAIVILIVHSLVAYSGMRHASGTAMAESNIPHWVLVNAIFGNAGKLIIAVITITTTAGVINSLLATIPRMLYGMAHHKQLPSVFMKLHKQWKTPWISIISVATLIALPMFILKDSKDLLSLLVASSATIWLLTYITAHINVIVLRKKYPNFKRPFKSRWYPLPQIMGIIGMGFAIVKNSPTPELTAKVYTNALLFISIIAVYAFFWVKYKMKKDLFEAEPIEEALTD
jgi:amino acid transporter